jgi:hypothetical protein
MNSKRARDLKRGDYLSDDGGGVHAVLAVWKVGKMWSIKTIPMHRDALPPATTYGVPGNTRFALPAPRDRHGYAF